MRVALSIMPIDSSTGKPKRLPPPAARRGSSRRSPRHGPRPASRGASQKIAAADGKADQPMIASTGCQGSSTSSSEAAAGTDILPMSPAKL